MALSFVIEAGVGGVCVKKPSKALPFSGISGGPSLICAHTYKLAWRI